MKKILFNTASVILILAIAYCMHRYIAIATAMISHFGNGGLLLLTTVSAVTLLFPFTPKSLKLSDQSLSRVTFKFIVTTFIIIAAFSAWSIATYFWIFPLVAFRFLVVQIIIIIALLPWVFLVQHYHHKIAIIWLLIFLIVVALLNIFLVKTDISLPLQSRDEYELEFINAYVQHSKDTQFCERIDKQTILRNHQLNELSKCDELHMFNEDGTPLHLYYAVAPRTLGDSRHNYRRGLRIWEDYGFSNDDPFFESCQKIVQLFVDEQREKCRLILDRN